MSFVVVYFSDIGENLLCFPLQFRNFWSIAWFIGPTDLGGWSYKLTHVSPSFRPSFRPSISMMFFGLFSNTALRIFPIFCMSVEDNRSHWLSKIVSLKKFLIPDYRGLSVQKRCFSYFFGLYSKTALMFFPILCMSVEDNRAHCLSKIVFLKKFLILDYRGLSVQKRCFFTSLHFTPKRL